MQALGFVLQEEAVLQTITQDVLTSSEIEGELLHADLVRSSVARHLGMEIGGSRPIDRNVEGVVDMMLDATQHYEKALTADRLFGWHAALFPSGRSGLYKITVGAWRTDKNGPMQAVSGAIGKERVHYEAPAATMVKQEMKQFIAWFNSHKETDPIIDAVIAHLWFVTIHPFSDGNGRIARAIADMQLARADGSAQRFYSMSSQIRNERNTYHAILETTQKGGLDITEWLRWFLDCFDRALAATGEILAGVMRKAKFWEQHPAAGFNDRKRNTCQGSGGRAKHKLCAGKKCKILQEPGGRCRDRTYDPQIMSLLL